MVCTVCLTKENALEYVTTYREALEKVYRKRRNLKALKLPLEQALKDDEWRYESVTKSTDRSFDSGLSKDELRRLMRWKLAHGQYRSTLQALIEKNSEAEVRQHTDAAEKIVAGLTDIDDTAITKLKAALKEVTKLKGVGPATGSLVLSVFNPRTIPFFQDELFAWLFAGKQQAVPKLKYDIAEYEQIITQSFTLMNKFDLSAQDLEQLTFVLIQNVTSDDQTSEPIKECCNGNKKTLKRNLDTANSSESEVREKEETVAARQTRRKKG